MIKKSDIESIQALLLEINSKLKTMALIFPEEEEPLLKHFAAASIHLAIFGMDLYDHISGTVTDKDKFKVNEFLEKCGCDYNERYKVSK